MTEAPDRRPDALPAAARRRASSGSSTRSATSSTSACSPGRGRARRPATSTFRLVPRLPVARRSARSTRRCRSASRASSRRFRPDAVTPRARTRRSRWSPAAPRAPERSADRRAARRLAHVRRGSTARRFAERWRRSPTASRRGRCAARTPCGRSRRTRPASSREAGVEPAADVHRLHRPRARSRTRRLRRCRRRREALFVGVLERYKNVEGLAAAWRLVAAWMPEARLRIVGDGHRRDVVEDPRRASSPSGSRGRRRCRRRASSTRSTPRRLLLLPVARGGTPRIVLEAFCRGRAVVGGRVGGIPDLVEDGVNGLLVDPDDVEAARRGARARALESRARRAAGTSGARTCGDRSCSRPSSTRERMRELVERAVTAR